MTKNISKKNNKSHLKIILGVIASLLVMIIIFIVSYGPITNVIEKNRFEQLDKSMQKIYQELVLLSDGPNQWSYKKTCEPERSGPWETGSYYCSIKISLSKDVSSASEVSTLHDKYFPIIDQSSSLKPTTELDRQPVGVFGQKFVVSSAEKRYIEKNTNINCTYLAKISQKDDSNITSLNLYGTDIINNNGNGKIALVCETKTIYSY